MTDELKRIRSLMFLCEDRENTSMKAAIKYLIGRGQSKEDAQRIFDAIRNDIPSVRMPLYTNSNGREKGTYKFAIGVERMYLDGELSDGQTVMRLNQTLKLLANGHENEYDANLNGLSAIELNKRFETAAADQMQKDMDDVNSEEYASNGYTVVKIPDFETARKYGKYTSWCVTHHANMYDSYTSEGFGLFYFFLKDGFENVEEVCGEGCPLDEYGLSMIAVSVNSDGSLNTVTCRWNHDNGGNDNIMDAKQLSRVVGMNIYQVCKPYTKEELRAKGLVLFEDVPEMLANGVNPRQIFSSLYNNGNGFMKVELNFKYNLLTPERKLLSPDLWFDDCYRFSDSFAIVKLKEKYNFINENGEILSTDLWFDFCWKFSDNFAIVLLNEKYNFINEKGELLSTDLWFESCYNFTNGFGIVSDENGWFNIINKEGRLLSPNQWFDDCGEFSNGYAKVEIEGEYNFIDEQGNLISPDQWFDECTPFRNGFAYVGLNGKVNIMNDKGQLLSPDQWFDVCSDVINGFSTIKINGRFGKIDTNGNVTYDDEKPMVNEVRYIYPPMSKTPRGVEHDRSDRWENQEPIKNGEKIRVFHATDLKTAIRIAKEGLSGEERVPRNFSYEAGMNPAGLFVSTNFDVVKDFGFQGNNQVILEFTADTNDLDTPVWNNQGTYFGQGSNPQPFRNRDERTAQRQTYDDEASKSEYDYITKSDNPALAEKIFTNNEHQALFFGDLNPNMIKRWWVKDIYHYDKDWKRTQEDWTARFVPMTLTQFLRKYGKYIYQERNYKGEYENKPVQKTKLFKPNEDFSIEEFARREAMDKDGNVNQEDYNSTLEYLKDNIQRWRSGDFGWGDAAMLKELLFPKQLVQMLGTENYRENFNSMFPQQYGKETKYGNNQYNNMKGNDRISLTESEFNKIVRNVSRKIIKESFNTNRGQYMAGRVHARRMANPSKYTGQLFYAADHANDMAGGKWSDPFDRGYELEKDPLASDKTRRDAYQAFKDVDMNQLGSKFIRFIESNDSGSMLQTIVDYESGNQTGEPCSPLPAIIPEFEAAMGIKCTPEMKQAIKKAYNNWWYYAQETLMPEEDGSLNENTKKSKKARITENTLRNIVRESIKKTLKQTKD